MSPSPCKMSKKKKIENFSDQSERTRLGHELVVVTLCFSHWAVSEGRIWMTRRTHWSSSFSRTTQAGDCGLSCTTGEQKFFRKVKRAPLRLVTGLPDQAPRLRIQTAGFCLRRCVLPFSFLLAWCAILGENFKYSILFVFLPGCARALLFGHLPLPILLHVISSIRYR